MWSKRPSTQHARFTHLHGATLFISAKGIMTRMPGTRAFHSRSAIKAVTRQKALILLWTASGTAFAIPERLLQPHQQRALISFIDTTSRPFIQSA